MARRKSNAQSGGAGVSSILSLLSLLTCLWRKISPNRQKKFRWLLFVMVTASFAEVISIGAAFPFLAAITVPEVVFKNSIVQAIAVPLGLTESSQLLLPLTVIFGLAVLFSGVVRLILVVASTRLSYSTGGELSIDIYRRTLYQPYSVQIGRNSSEVIAGILGKANGVVGYAIQPALTIVSSVITLSVIFVSLVLIAPVVTLSVFAGISLIYFGIAKLFRRRLMLSSQRVAMESNHVIKALQEGLGGIRDVLIDGTQETYCRVFQGANAPLRKAQGDTQIISQAPRYIIEMIGMLLIAMVAYHLTGKPEGLDATIPLLGALAFAAQRTLPVIQQVYANISVMRGGQASMKDALSLLEQPIPSEFVTRVTSLEFKESIRLNQVAYRYPNGDKLVIKDLNLEISKGSRLGIIGESGSGKSTLLDLIMGLIYPIKGTIEVDGKVVIGSTNGARGGGASLGEDGSPMNIASWRAHIAHVPQAIFLADSSIEENIALGIPKNQIDSGRVKMAASQARIADVIEGWPDQYRTHVGERGVRLSGGQRQRIGIARALYKQADVIIFDEATSALDGETEEAVMDAIDGLSKDLTLVIVAHRLSTLRNCTEIVELGDGGIKRRTSYSQLDISYIN